MTPSGYSPASFTKSTVIVGSAKPKPPIFVLRPRHVLGAIALVLVLGAVYFFGYEPSYKGTLVIQAPRPLLLTPRALADHVAANSLNSVDHALEAGMDGMAVDGRLTDRNELEIFLGGVSVGPFTDFVRSVKGRGLVLVDLEAPGVEQRAVEVIRKYDAHLSVVLSSSNPLVLYRVKHLDPLVRTAYIFADSKPAEPVNPSWALRQEFVRRGVRKVVRFDMLSINHQVDGAVIDRLIAKGWPAFIWAPSTEADIHRAMARRPYGVISDEPILARQVRGE